MMRALSRFALVIGLAAATSACGMIRGVDAEGQEAELRDGEGGEVSVAERISAARPGMARRGAASAPLAAIVEAEGASAAPELEDQAEAGFAGVEVETRSVLHAMHLASYRTEANAVTGWGVLTSEVPAELAGLHPRIETVDLGPEQGVFHRLKAGPLDSREAALARCASLSGAGYYCRAVDFEGRDVGEDAGE